MRYYILDDDINIVKILQNIVETDFERLVIGSNTDPEKAIKEILTLKPDAVLIDYLMPSLDGTDVIKKVKALNPDIEFIMISQVADKEMIGDAYKEGLSFFISKPINKIEVNVVLSNLENRLETSEKLKQIISLIGDAHTPAQTVSSHVDQAKSVLFDLGIYSEKGSKDILSIIEIMDNKNMVDSKKAFNHYSKDVKEKGKIIRQRIRRAIGKALRNISYLGLEDYMNETFVKYSSTLFNFESVKLEMDYIRGTSTTRGSVSISKFLENLHEVE